MKSFFWKYTFLMIMKRNKISPFLKTKTKFRTSIFNRNPQLYKVLCSNKKIIFIEIEPYQSRNILQMIKFQENLSMRAVNNNNTAGT